VRFFDASREKFISPVPVSHTICQIFKCVPCKTCVFDVSRKKIFLGAALGFWYRIYMYLCIPSHIRYVRFLCAKVQKLPFFGCLLNFFCKKKTGSSARLRLREYPPEYLLIYMVFVRCRYPISPRAVAPCVCPFQVPNYNVLNLGILFVSLL